MKTILLAVLLLVGCTTTPLAAQNAADKEVEGAVYLICNAISIGAWQRYFGTNLERASAWHTLCAPTVVSPKP